MSSYWPFSRVCTVTLAEAAVGALLDSLLNSTARKTDKQRLHKLETGAYLLLGLGGQLPLSKPVTHKSAHYVTGTETTQMRWANFSSCPSDGWENPTLLQVCHVVWLCTITCCSGDNNHIWGCDGGCLFGQGNICRFDTSSSSAGGREPRPFTSCKWDVYPDGCYVILTKTDQK